MANSVLTTSTTAQRKFDNNTIDRMIYNLRYNIEIFLQLYSYFVQNNVQAILNYYTNSATNPDLESFDFLNDLLTESAKIKALITLNKKSFTQIDDWELLDFLQTIDVKLQTIFNTAKWTRSSKTQNSWRGANIQTTYAMRDGQTIESVSEQFYGAGASQDDWMRIAIENDLSERDYQANSNNTINITKQQLSSPNIFLNSIVDNLTNEKLYGLDINKKLNFAGDDIEVLSYNDTFVQSVAVLISVKKGDNPEFAAVGVDSALAVGASYGSLKFSSIVRQLQELFATDDSITTFNVTNISYQNGALLISYQADSFYHFSNSGQTQIQQQ